MLKVPHKAMEKNRLDVLGKLAPYMEKNTTWSLLDTTSREGSGWIQHPTEEGETKEPEERSGPVGTSRPSHRNGSSVGLQEHKEN